MEHIMNIHQASDSAAKSRPNEKRGTGRRGGLPARTRELPSRAAGRLMKALDESGASAMPDPTRDGMLIVRTRRAGISLGRGAHPAAAAGELLRLDLAQRCEAGGGAVELSAAGRAHLRRVAAGDPATRFRDQHLDIVDSRIAGEDGPVKAAVDAGESPLAWLRRRKDRDGLPMIDAAAFEAGERLRRDLTFAGILPSITARWEGAIDKGNGGLRDPAAATDATIAARQRVRAALGEVGGELADLLVDLCGFLKGLELIERERRWPPRSAKVVVRLALGRLAEHYGLSGEARGSTASRALRVWQADGDMRR